MPITSNLAQNLNETPQAPISKKQELSAQQLSAVPLKFITCGSVDDGKSTLIGRLLWDSKAVKEDHAANLKGEAVQNSLGLPDFALLLDGLQAEREQGITIDVAWRYFSTPSRAFIIADTPGHEQYTRNMATAASTADLAVLLVDASQGLSQQTKRHATIAAFMGIGQFILAINKMDLVNYDKSRFEQIDHEFQQYALSLGVRDIKAVPISALKGENIVNGCDAMPWYRGETLAKLLEQGAVRAEQATGFRMSVQRVCRPDEHFRGFQGTVAGGAIKPGDTVMVLPSRQQANVKEIVTFDLVRNAAVSGDAITLVLDRELDISRGDMLVSHDALPQMGRNFKGRMVALDNAALSLGKRYWLKSGSRRQRVSFQNPQTLDLKTGEWHQSTQLDMNDIAKIQLKFEDEAIFDTYDQNHRTGSFILIDPQSNNTVAGGMIDGLEARVEQLNQDEGLVTLQLPKPLAEKLMNSQLSLEERAQIKIF